MQEIENESGAQVPNSAGVVEDPREIPPAPPVHPEDSTVEESTYVPDAEDVEK
jgi:hypothetical protein